MAGTWSKELDGPVHDVQPGDYVYVKCFAEKTPELQWEGPFLVLLTTFTAIKIKEQSAWIHHSQVKKAPEGFWKVIPDDKELKLNFLRKIECGWNGKHSLTTLQRIERLAVVMDNRVGIAWRVVAFVTTAIATPNAIPHGYNVSGMYRRQGKA